MSLEKRREPKETESESILKESNFRQLDFTPLELKREKKDEVIEREIITEELTEIEKDILEIAIKILKLKRYSISFDIQGKTKEEVQKFPIIEKLYAACISKLAYKKGYSKEDIFLGIRNLEKKYWIVTNERRTKLEILENERLMSILKFINKYPGIHARSEKIETELKITRTPFLKHTITLERFKLIRSKKIGKTLHYFPINTPEDFDELKALFTNSLVVKIIELILRDKDITISRLGEELNLYSGTIQYYIKKLRDANILTIQKQDDESKKLIIDQDLLKKYNEVFKDPPFVKIINELEHIS